MLVHGRGAVAARAQAEAEVREAATHAACRLAQARVAQQGTPRAPPHAQVVQVAQTGVEVAQEEVAQEEAAQEEVAQAMASAARRPFERLESDADLPEEWEPMHGAPMRLVDLAMHSTEWASVVCDRFDASIMSAGRNMDAQSMRWERPTVCRVQRIQNAELWRAYACRRRALLDRERHTTPPRRRPGARGQAAVAGGGGGGGDLERTGLFHGTDHESAITIARDGFNRSFAGRHAVRLGKGSYLARDASYAAMERYATPDACGLQHVLICRMLVGRYCVGHASISVPPFVRPPSAAAAGRGPTPPRLRYDSTVDRVDDPELWVAYHDAQIYPDYLLTFGNPSAGWQV